MSKGQRLRRLQQAVKPAAVSKESDKSTSDSDSSREDGKEVCAAITTGFYFGKVEQLDGETKKILSKKKKNPWSQAESPVRSSTVPMPSVQAEPTPGVDDYWYYDNGSRGYFYGNAGGMGWRRLRIGSLKLSKEDSGVSSPGSCSPPISEGIPDIGRLSVDSEKKVVEIPSNNAQEFAWNYSWDKLLSEIASADEDALAEKIRQSATFWK